MSRSSGTSATTTSPRSSPLCRFRPQAHRSRRAASSSPTSSSASTTERTRRRCRRRRRRCAGPSHRRPSTRNWCGARRSTSSPATSSGRPLAAGRAPRPLPRPTLPGAPRVNPSPYLFLLELGDIALVGSSPETLVKREGPRASLIRSPADCRPGEGDGGRLLALRQGPSRARHAGRPRSERPLARLPARDSRVERFMQPERFSHVTHLVSEVVGRAQRRDAVRPPARVLPGRHRLGRAEGARHADDSELEGYRRGTLRRRGGLRAPDGTLDTCIAIRTLVRGTASRLQAGGGSSPTRTRPPSTGSA